MLPSLPGLTLCPPELNVRDRPVAVLIYIHPAPFGFRDGRPHNLHIRATLADRDNERLAPLESFDAENPLVDSEQMSGIAKETRPIWCDVGVPALV